MNAPHHQLDLAEVPDSDSETLLKFIQVCMAELQMRAASSQYGDFLHLKTAAAITGRSRETIRRWILDDPSMGQRTPCGWLVHTSRLMERCARS
jgi:hypothetical protein